MTLMMSPAPATNVRWILGDNALPGHVNPDDFAVRWTNGERTYAQLRQRALTLAEGLRAAGAQPGDRVAVHLFNRGEIFDIYFACAFAGLTMVPINFRLSPREIGFILEDCEPSVIFTETDLLDTMDPAIENIGANSAHKVCLEAEASGAVYESFFADSEITELSGTDIQLLLYTSGTTGRPKGVVMKHANIMNFAMQQATFYDGLNHQAVLMLTGPMYNTAGINEQSIPTFFAGGTVVIMPSRGWKPARMAELMDGWAVTHALIYPSMIDPILEADAESPINLSTLKFALTGGENCPPSAMKKFMDRWPHVVLMIAYGSTETGCISLIKGQEILDHPASVGRSIGGQTVGIFGSDLTPSAVNEIGEIWTAGPSIAAGYWRAPELDAVTFSNGWVNSGDLGRIDEAGYLYIEGRSKDMIISKGQNIYPSEIESVLFEHPRIREVAVIGIPDQEFGETVCACVVTVDGQEMTLAEIHEYTNDRLASFKKPRVVITYDSLPRNASGKIVKKRISINLANGKELSHG